MLDEEVIIKTPKHSCEIYLISNILIMLATAAFLFGGSAHFSEALLITMGIIAPINVLIYKHVWLDAKPLTTTKYALLLSPYLIVLLLTIFSFFNPLITEEIFGSSTYFSLNNLNSALPATAAYDMLVAILSDLTTISVVACALSIYFITDSRFILRTIFFWSAIIVAVLSLLGFVFIFVYDFFNVNLHFEILGPRSFATFPDKFHWSSFATIWLGATLAISLYSSQNFNFNNFIFSFRFMVLALAAVIFASAIYTATPMQMLSIYGLCCLGFMLLALDVRPTELNLTRHEPNRSWHSKKKRFTRGIAPMFLYGIIALVMFVMAAKTLNDSLFDPEERMLCDSTDKYSITYKERIELFNNSYKVAAERPLFGWGTSSYPVVMAFKQDSSMGYSPWLSPRSDLLKIIIENGVVGLFLVALTPMIFFLFWVLRCSISKSGLLMFVTCTMILLQSVLDYPFQSPAVLLSFWILFVGMFKWENAKVR